MGAEAFRRAGCAPRLAVCAALGLVLVGDAPLWAVDVALDRDAIDQAIVFARQAERGERQAFHDDYVRTPGDGVRRVSVVTEYRRVVLAVEERRRVLDRSYGVRQMTEMLTPWRGLVEIIVELQFHPQNAFVSVPLVDLLLVPLDVPGNPMPLVAAATERRPRFGLFWEPTPPDAPWWPFPPPTTPVLAGSEPLTGGWVQARFDARECSRGRHQVVVKDGAKTLGRVDFDFGAIR